MKHAQGFMMLAGAAMMMSLVASPAMARRHDASADKKAALYPNATRTEPKLDLHSGKDQKNLQAGLDAVNAGDKAKAQQYLQPIIDKSDSKYAKALALQGLATIKYKDNDLKGAMSLLQQSLALNSLPNDTYFQLEYEMAQFQAADKQYQAALNTLTQWRAEGKKETAQSYGLEGTIDYRLQKYPEAIAAINKAESMTDKPDSSWNQVLMASYSESGQGDKAAALAQKQLSASPNDPAALANAVSTLVQAKKDDQAIQLLEKARASGPLSEENYVTLSKLYLITAQSSDDAKPDALKAAGVLQDGMTKGVVKPNATNYMLLGEANEMADSSTKAEEAYSKANTTASDGEAAMRGGHLLLVDGKYSQAKSLIQQAIQKGVKHKGTAYMLLAESERGLKNKPAAIAAMKKAEQQPETAAKARAWLKKAGA